MNAPRHLLPASGTFSLAQTCGPVAWAVGRWPSVDWLDGALLWVGWDGDRVVWREVRQADTGLALRGSADPAGDRAWARAKLGIDQEPPTFTDPVLGGIAASLPGLRPYADGSLAEGLLTSIIGQSISIAAAAVTQARLCQRFHDGIDLAGRRFWPFPRLDQLAAADPIQVRAAGVTTRRAGAIVCIARAALDGGLPSAESARADHDTARAALRTLPLVGPWTAASTLLWGIGHPDAFPTGDVALLRAVRSAYQQPDLALPDLDRLADQWRPARGWAARYLWAALLGVPAAADDPFGLYSTTGP